ncbi:MAG: DEAD/DEAH box helicase [Microcoleus sp. PH2017_01_SCD_O_A]|uniref:DNA repair helicase XPB n=1 Tax=Microcoleus sp. PH2017_01_SCD_O_A TaxID=2798812 RepID=UPI001D6BE58F|nr:DNA repair helicase XPB [Microcoleus sp. PH2017_01_SCD_O_A]MCC3425824.1 DEAD/DEAH box helicase [Microcoleus sp. PH2017_01_SCD_O_A]
MSYVAENALIVQSDRSILLEVHAPTAKLAREAIAPFAELIKSPEHIHTYRITPLSVWNARAAGMLVELMIAALRKYAKYDIPESVAQEIELLGTRYGLTVIERIDAENPNLQLRIVDRPLTELLVRDDRVKPLLGKRISDLCFQVDAGNRGVLKQVLLAVGYPAEDLAGYIEGAELAIALRDRTLGGDLPFNLRAYQKEAVEAFYQGGEVRGGSGTIVLPCGAGKTIVGMIAMSLVQQKTLILTSSLTSVHQWRREILDKTSLTEDAIAEYSSNSKKTASVTLSTYQMLSYRSTKDDEFPHFELFNAQSWGLIIYDEVHLLPAPIFRITADLQARRRLGLTATLIREDGKEGDVFTLIGPKRYDVPWRELEGQGFIATANCTEIRVAQNEAEKMEYALAPRRSQFRIAAENPGKLDVVQGLLQKEAGHRILIIGEYLEQLDAIALVTQLPLITGKTKQVERDRLYEAFRHKEIPGLILSRVGNFAVDLPDADVLIQVSGKYGSRQEEAQRLGRILRPKSDGHTASFYTLVSLQTCEEDFARHRQLFLTEQGYSYTIEVQGDG